MIIIKHFVTFESPGTFFAELTTREIDSWDVAQSASLAATITERYGARPYGFFFTTRTRGEEDFESHQTAHSAFYYLGGVVKTLAQLEEEADPKLAILRGNMQSNGWSEVIITDNSWRWTAVLHENDVILDPLPKVDATKTV